MALNIFATVSKAESCAALFPSSVDSCKASVDRAKKRLDSALSRIFAIPSSQRTFANTALPTDIAITEVKVAAGLLSVVAQVSTEKAVRDEASAQMVNIEQYSIENLSTNRQLFQALKDVEANDAPKDAQYAYWLQMQLDDFRRKGMELAEEQFQKVKQLEMELSSLASQFHQNIAADATKLEFTAEELVGTPDVVLSALHVESGKYTVKMDYPTVNGILDNCEVAATRKKVAQAFNDRGYPVNESILKEAIRKRHMLSQVLGFSSYAHLNLADKMAKNPETAKQFIEDLAPKVLKKWEKELELIKKNLPKGCTLSNEGTVEAYDVMYIMNQMKKSLWQVDERMIQEYFPLQETIKGLLFIYQSFFNITLTEVTDVKDLWHSDVSMLEVKDKTSGDLLGFIILDLFPRDGKFTHACCHSVVPPVIQSESSFSPALGVVVANFPVASGERPSLFTHSDVKTFFHEFGHALHGLMGRTKLSSLAGTDVKLDFVELPSQMLEEWLWEPMMLQQITKHYSTGAPLPTELIKAKVDSKNAFSGRDTLRQLQFASYSLELFGATFATSSDLNTTELFHQIEPRLMPGIHYMPSTHFECAFGHLMGYDAGYYGYMWSKVFAIDVFSSIREQNGLLSPLIGCRYANSILKPGGTRDPNESIEEFLQRKPNNKAFLANIGL